MATIILNAAHGGNNIGLIHGNRMEKTDNLKLAFAVGEIFENNGIETVYTRNSDKYLSQLTRLQIVDQCGGDLLLSFHRMSSCTPNCNPGMDFFVEHGCGFSKKIAENIKDHLEPVGFYNYGIKDNLSDYLLSNIKIPGINMNIGFIDCKRDNKLYDCSIQDIAEAIAEGVMEKMGIQQKIKYHFSVENSIKIILDAGHGGYDMGIIYRNRLEKKDNLRLTLAVGSVLKKNGVTVIYTRASDQAVLPLERINIANHEGGDLLLSFHRMMGTIPKCNQGVEAFVNGDSEIGEAVALNIGENLYELGFHNHGIYNESEVTLLKETAMPAIMLMIGYIDSDLDNELFDLHLLDMANAIANGILLTFGIGKGDTMQENHIEEEKISHYRVQIGLFKTYTNAVKYQKMIENKGLLPQIAMQGELYSVQVGDFINLDEAANFEKTLRIQKLHTLIIAE